MKNLIVSCPTKEECEAVQKKMFSEGRVWRSGKVIFNCWNLYKRQTCLDSLEEDKFIVSYDNKKEYKETYPNIPIITAEEYLRETMTKRLYIVIDKEYYEQNHASYGDLFIYKTLGEAERELNIGQILIETTIDKIFEKGGLKEIEI